MDYYERALIALKDLLPQDVTDEFTVLEVQKEQDPNGLSSWTPSTGSRFTGHLSRDHAQ